MQQDAVNEWKKKLEQADGFIITGDIRNSGLCSLMVGLLERFAQMGKASSKFLAGKIGGFGAVGVRDGGMKGLFDIVSFFQHHERHFDMAVLLALYMERRYRRPFRRM